MSRPRQIDAKLVVRARAALGQAASVQQLRAAQAVLLPALAHTTLEQTAALLGGGGEPCQRSAAAAAIPRRVAARAFLPSPLGRTAASADGDRGRESLPSP